MARDGEAWPGLARELAAAECFDRVQVPEPQIERHGWGRRGGPRCGTVGYGEERCGLAEWGTLWRGEVGLGKGRWGEAGAGGARQGGVSAVAECFIWVQVPGPQIGQAGRGVVWPGWVWRAEVGQGKGGTVFDRWRNARSSTDKLLLSVGCFELHCTLMMRKDQATMEIYMARIEGVSALLQHRFSEESEAAVSSSTRTVKRREETPREAAERVAYRYPDGTLYLPGAAIARLLREAGANHKMKGSRRSVKYLVPGAVIVPDETLALIDPETDTPAGDFEVDSRPVVIPATKGRVMRHRPRLDAWATEFTLEVDDEMLDGAFVHQLLTEGGRKLGLGDFRPERGGPFGRFHVTVWKRVE